jgi:hypothetical protein
LLGLIESAAGEEPVSPSYADPVFSEPTPLSALMKFLLGLLM